MLVSTAFILAAFGAPGTATPPKTPTAEVIISGGLLSLPYLPANADEARQGNTKVQLDLQKGISDIEAHLKSLYPLLAQEPPLGPSLGVPKDQAQEAKFFASILNDEAAATMEDRLLEMWNTWQAALTKSGVAESVGKPAAVQESAKAEAKSADLTMELRRTNRPAEMVKGDKAYVYGLNWTQPVIKHSSVLKFRRVEWKTIGFDNQNHQVSHERAQKARVHAVATKQQALELAPLWNPLAGHLNAQAKTLMDYERPSAGALPPSMKVLRLQGKIRFLERYRQVMWVCGVFWAQMASSDVPAPLKPLS
jgi:hypothetical protein